jgi:hypothetical protein
MGCSGQFRSQKGPGPLEIPHYVFCQGKKVISRTFRISGTLIVLRWGMIQYKIQMNIGHYKITCFKLKDIMVVILVCKLYCWRHQKGTGTSRI